jgi:transcriptional regulator with XRE-family HTH domain
METVVKEVGQRLREMRQIMDISPEKMAASCGVSVKKYEEIEAGLSDFTFTFLHRAARQLGIDLTELLTGEAPHRSGYTLIRAGQGLPIARRAGFSYLNLAPYFRGRLAEPFHVTAPAEPDGRTCQITMSSHSGQEMDYIIEGSLRIKIGQHEEILQAGDTIYYDSSTPHGMVALDGPCKFLAFVIGTNNQQEE